MSKKPEIYKKDLKIKDPLVETLADIGGEDLEYVTLLQHVEDKSDYKHIPDDSELRLIRYRIPRLSIVDLDTSARLIVKDATVGWPTIVKV